MAEGQTALLPELLRRRYRDGGPTLPNELHAPQLSGLLSHRSVRRYGPEPLADGTLELLIAAAQSAASSSNLQLWSAISVEDPERRRLLSEVAGGQAHVRESPLFLVWLADLHRITQLATAHELASEGVEFLEMFLMASVDAALAAQNAVLAAEAIGLGTVYIGALRNQPQQVAEILQLPPRVFALFGLCVGFADEAAAPAVKPRLPQSVVLGRDTYPALSAEQATIRDYDQTMLQFYREQRMEVPSGGWSQHSAERVRSVAALRGRHQLRQALNALGFALR